MTLKKISIPLVILFVLSMLVFQACKKENEENLTPNCNITAPEDGEEFKQSEIVTISVNATDNDGTIVEVTFSVDGENIGSANSSPYNYDWNTTGVDVGDHTIKATCIDDGDASASDVVTIMILENNPSDFAASPTVGDAPLSVTFTDQSTGDPTSWYWDFGDGSSSTEQSPTHIYNTMDQYDVTLIATYENGSDTVTKTDFISVRGTFEDPRDSLIYTTVKIGDQIWFAENLNYASEESLLYKDNEENGDIYGRLYTWDDAQNACPGGWHLSSDEEWKTLETYVGMPAEELEKFTMRGAGEGTKLKSTTIWSEEGKGTDEVGFSALPAGYREQGGNFNYLNSYTGWWTSDKLVEAGIYRYLEDIDGIGRFRYHPLTGFSVRCVKN